MALKEIEDKAKELTSMLRSKLDVKQRLLDNLQNQAAEWKPSYADMVVVVNPQMLTALNPAENNA